MRNYLLGIDGGGTKTEAALCTLEGRVVHSLRAEASSISGQSVEQAFSHLEEMVQKLLQTCGASVDQLAGYYAGISGAGLPQNQALFADFFKKLLPSVPGDAGSDAANALSSGIALEDGSIAIAGTGACVQYRRQGKLNRISGWGYILGDEGSGYDLGRRALSATMQAADGRRSHSLLTQLCLEKMGQAPDGFAAWLYRQDVKTVVAAYAPLLLQAAQEDTLAGQLLEEAVQGMAHAIMTSVRLSESHQVVLGGSLWNSAVYRRCVQKHIAPEVRLVQPACRPVYGAVVMAGQYANVADSRRLLEHLCTHLKKETDS